MRDAADSVAQRLIRTRSTWTITPGALGPLVVGMTGRQALATPNVKRTPNAMCGNPYDFTGKTQFEWVLMEWRIGFRDRLDDLLVKSPTVRTPQGVGVGSSRAELSAAFGGDLTDAAVFFELDPSAGVLAQPAVYSSGRVMLFLTSPTGTVETIHLRAARQGEVVRLSGGC